MDEETDKKIETEEVDGEKYVVAAELARAAGVNRVAVYQAVRLGRLNSIERLGRRLIPLADALKWKDAKHGNFSETGKSGRKRKEVTE